MPEDREPHGDRSGSQDHGGGPDGGLEPLTAAAPPTDSDARFHGRTEDLDRALEELIRAAGRDPALWERARPGKWTAGQHVAHVVVSIAATSGPLEEGVTLLRAGQLRPRPRRGPLQRLWVRLVVGRGTFPRGGKTRPEFEPPSSPSREETLALLRRETERHRSVGATLDADEREQLWIPNPFLPRWHYTYLEILRVHAVHARHHAKLIDEIR